MIIKRLVLLILLVTASAGVYGQRGVQSRTRDTKAEQEVRAVLQQLIDAGARKDRAAYERLLADGFTFVHSTGGIETRLEYMDHALSGTQLFQRAERELLSEQLNIYEGRTAIWTAHTIWRNKSDQSETIHRSTNVFIKEDGRWRWAAGQSTRLPTRPQAAAIDHGLYQDYAGQYEVGAGRTLTVTQEGETLRALFTGVRPAELVPQSTTEFVWFNPDYNVYSEIIFIKDESERVTHAAFRRDGQEIWRAKKIK